MKLSATDLLNLSIPQTLRSYTAHDTILYALGLGLGLDPLDPRQLRFVLENDLQALPSLVTVLAQERSWFFDERIGLDIATGVQLEHAIRLYRPLAPTGTLRGKTRIVDVVDKGSGRGAIIAVETNLFDEDVPVASSVQTIYFRNNGGFGGVDRPRPCRQSWPESPADHVFIHPTSTQGALIYRLSGDDTIIHADPAAAIRAGFERPILHGLATFGLAAYAVVATCCDNRPERLGALACSFVAPVFPGETLRVEIWREGEQARFRVACVERGSVVADNGQATFIQAT